jgi:hypothetical protein
MESPRYFRIRPIGSWLEQLQQGIAAGEMELGGCVRHQFGTGRLEWDKAGRTRIEQMMSPPTRISNKRWPRDQLARFEQRISDERLNSFGILLVLN